MKVLVTGASGQVGQALLAAGPAGFEVIGKTRAELDITRRDVVDDCIVRIKPDVIVNAAAYTAVDRAESEVELARRTNELAPEYLARSAAEIGARVLHLSTDFVFDGESSVAYAPDADPHPLSVYGSTKLAGERIVRTILPANSLILRTAWVYAAEGRNFVRTMLQTMRQRRTVRVVADQIGAPTAAGSVAQAIWALVERRAPAGVYHWTDAGVASWYDFAVAIAEEGAAAGHLSEPVEVLPITTEEYPTAARRPRFSVLDRRATVAATGLVPAHWRSNLRRVLRELAVA